MLENEIPPAAIKPLVVRPSAARVMLSCTQPTLYKLLNAGELQSFKEGEHGRRLIVVQSIYDYIARKVAAEKATAAA
jgi:hypothetical protein